jgi:hypothetical protein
MFPIWGSGGGEVARTLLCELIFRPFKNFCSSACGSGDGRMKNTPSSSESVGCFGRIYRLHLQGSIQKQQQRYAG